MQKDCECALISFVKAAQSLEQATVGKFFEPPLRGTMQACWGEAFQWATQMLQTCQNKSV